MNPPLIEFRDVSFAYEKDRVINDISTRIQPEDLIGVIGPNGYGKSTLLKLLAGVLKPDTGHASFRGNPLSHYKRKILARSIAWVPQDHPVVFPFNVSEIVMMGRNPYLSALAFESEEDMKIAWNAMEMTEVTQFAHRKFNEISGGEKQRVMIASAIAQETETMLLDEPTSALDIKYQVEILNILRRLNREKGMALVLAMHDLHLASKYCKRLLLIQSGRIVCEGSPDEVLKKEVLEEVYGIRLRIFRDGKDGSYMISPEA